MKTKYLDRDGKPVSIGDILYYNEGADYAKGIHEVILKDGVLYGLTRNFDYYDEWVSHIDTVDIVELKHYTFLSNGNVLNDAKIIGNVSTDKEMITLDYAKKNYPINKK